MAEADYTDLVAGQREYFHSGATRPAEWRRQQLEAMKALLADNRDRFFATLRRDLRRNDIDSDLMDVGFCIKEAEYGLRHMHHWMKAAREPTPLLLEPGHVRVRRDPLGVTLIIAAWNEPLMLTFGPLAPALAAGNTAVIKPSEMCAATSALIAELVPRYMDTSAVAVVQGAVPETTALLDQHWDLIFFTGSPQVGKIIHQAAAKHLTPAVLDLYIAPTVLVDVAWDSPIMHEEIFGPILPVLEIDSVPGVIKWVNGNPHLLGLYIFAEDDDITDQILSMTGSGDAVVNDCSLHPLVPELPFGGVGNSGMGKYHGHWGFEAFTNARGVLYHSPMIDPGVRYPPYSEHRRERALESKLP
jgi:acyl-CoA reductase-like NAD-dependent aldehyde dehydrogenase